MSNYPIHVNFPGRLVMVGFGSIGQGVLPLIFRHLAIKPDQVTIVTKDDAGEKVAAEYGARFVRQSLTRENFKKVLDPLVGRGDFLLNLSVDVSSVALIQFCWEQGSLYLDTCIEPWAGGYMDLTAPPARRTNYAFRETALALRNAKVQAPTAVITHGANPGLVSHLVKQALLNIAADTGLEHEEPASREAWAQLAQQLGVKVIHIAERDTQVGSRAKEQGEFVNTWSVDGFTGEGCQPAELGWGSHEKNWPRDGKKHDFGRGSAIYLMQPGAATRVRTWTPLARQIHGFLITHGEAISISDYLTVKKGEKVEYRPTVHYAYHPCNDAVLSVHELAGRNWLVQERKRIMVEEIVTGRDELGVLLAGHKKNAYWYGSQLSVQEARELCPHNNATSLQVTVSVLAGLVWAMENPNEGIVEPEDLDYRRILEICRPYLGPVVGEYTEWHPLVDRARLFPEDIDQTDPWQFKNVRVV
jgi:homospermidine synthase